MPNVADIRSSLPPQISRSRPWRCRRSQGGIGHKLIPSLFFQYGVHGVSKVYQQTCISTLCSASCPITRVHRTGHVPTLYNKSNPRYKCGASFDLSLAETQSSIVYVFFLHYNYSLYLHIITIQITLIGIAAA
jgi:hypothetical protein